MQRPADPWRQNDARAAGQEAHGHSPTSRSRGAARRTPWLGQVALSQRPRRAGGVSQRPNAEPPRARPPTERARAPCASAAAMSGEQLRLDGGMAVGDGIGMGDDAGTGTADRGWRLADRKHCAWIGRRRNRHRRRCWSWRGRRRRDRHGRRRRDRHCRQGLAARRLKTLRVDVLFSCVDAELTSSGIWAGLEPITTFPGAKSHPVLKDVSPL